MNIKQLFVTDYRRPNKRVFNNSKTPIFVVNLAKIGVSLFIDLMLETRPEILISNLMMEKYLTGFNK